MSEASIFKNINICNTNEEILLDQGNVSKSAFTPRKNQLFSLQKLHSKTNSNHHYLQQVSTNQKNEQALLQKETSSNNECSLKENLEEIQNILNNLKTNLSVIQKYSDILQQKYNEAQNQYEQNRDRQVIPENDVKLELDGETEQNLKNQKTGNLEQIQLEQNHDFQRKNSEQNLQTDLIAQKQNLNSLENALQNKAQFLLQILKDMQNVNQIFQYNIAPVNQDIKMEQIIQKHLKKFEIQKQFQQMNLFQRSSIESLMNQTKQTSRKKENIKKNQPCSLSQSLISEFEKKLLECSDKKQYSQQDLQIIQFKEEEDNDSQKDSNDNNKNLTQYISNPHDISMNNEQKLNFVGKGSITFQRNGEPITFQLFSKEKNQKIQQFLELTSSKNHQLRCQHFQYNMSEKVLKTIQTRYYVLQRNDLLWIKGFLLPENSENCAEFQQFLFQLQQQEQVVKIKQKHSAVYLTSANQIKKYLPQFQIENDQPWQIAYIFFGEIENLKIDLMNNIDKQEENKLKRKDQKSEVQLDNSNQDSGKKQQTSERNQLDDEIQLIKNQQESMTSVKKEESEDLNNLMIDEKLDKEKNDNNQISKTQPSKKRKYTSYNIKNQLTLQQKLEAVYLAEKTKNKSKTARIFGVDRNSVANWVKKKKLLESIPEELRRHRMKQIEQYLEKEDEKGTDILSLPFLQESLMEKDKDQTKEQQQQLINSFFSSEKSFSQFQQSGQRQPISQFIPQFQISPQQQNQYEQQQLKINQEKENKQQLQLQNSSSRKIQQNIILIGKEQPHQQNEKNFKQQFQKQQDSQIMQFNFQESQNSTSQQQKHKQSPYFSEYMQMFLQGLKNKNI